MSRQRPKPTRDRETALDVHIPGAPMPIVVVGVITKAEFEELRRVGLSRSASGIHVDNAVVEGKGRSPRRNGGTREHPKPRPDRHDG